ncbi:MAG TPA: type II secretion system F family protein [Oligoflexia bacterium]|nr:type II secretion system F family protein [Oligoflexia bacterium]HMR24153.1 type II secretion system F family protein [Oligoflexia bacterium]
MAVYVWEGLTQQGAVKKGTRKAKNQREVVQWLNRQRIRPKKITQQKKDFAKALNSFFSPSVKLKDVTIFCRQFATMIDAGLPLVQGLDILASQQENITFKRILTEIKQEVEGGSTFAEALAKHPAAFDDLFVNLVAAGEVGGILDTIFNRLSVYMEKAVGLRKKIKGAMFYPVGVLCVAAVVVAVLLTKVIPVFENMFKDFGNAELPAPTQVVINISHGFQNNFLFIMVGIGVFIYLWKLFYRSEKGRAIFDRYILKMPVIGDLIRKVAVARFTRTMATMLSSGVPIVDALEIVRKTAGNKTIEDAISRVKESISEGNTMTEPLSKAGVFPSMVCQMIGVGEATGAMDTMLNKIADFYEEEVDASVEALTSLMEPIMMVFLGGIIGGLVIAMYMPVFEMAGNIA